MERKTSRSFPVALVRYCTQGAIRERGVKRIRRTFRRRTSYFDVKKSEVWFRAGCGGVLLIVQGWSWVARGANLTIL
jgi:hypothetical protein